MNIHVVEPLNNFVKLQEDKWESSGWSIEESQAEKLIGGEIYFHKRRMEPSFFGGSITGCRVDENPKYQGKIIFTFHYDANCRNVNTDRHGWSKKVKIIGKE